LKINGKLVKAPNYPGSLFDICEKFTLSNSSLEASAYTKHKALLTLRLNISTLPDSHNQYTSLALTLHRKNLRSYSFKELKKWMP